VSVREPPPQTVDEVTQTLNEDAVNSQLKFGGDYPVVVALDAHHKQDWLLVRQSLQL